MKYDLTPQLLIALAVTTALAVTGVSQAQPGTGVSDGRSTLAEQLASANDRLDKAAARLVTVEDSIGQSRADVDRIAIELAEGRDPVAVTKELLQVRIRVDESQEALTDVTGELAALHDAFTKIRIAAATLKSPVIARQAATGLRRVQTMQTRAKNDQSTIDKLEMDIAALLDKARG